MIYGESTYTRKGVGGRTAQNEARSAAYYTTHQIGVLQEIFDFGTDPCICYDPSIGDGQMLIRVTGKKAGDNKSLFGTEIREAAAKEAGSNPLIEEVLCADFTNGIRMKNRHISFIAGNPPYMEDGTGSVDGRAKRLEDVFLEKVTQNYLRRGGILVWIIPLNTFLSLQTQRYFMAHYEINSVWKFNKSEWEKWHQVIIVARLIDTCYPSPERVKETQKAYAEDDGELIKELPETFQGTDYYQSVKVPASDPDALIPFTTQVFDCEGAYRLLMGSPEVYKEHLRSVSKKVTQEPFQSGSVGRPPIPLKKDSLYLLATSGAVGDGLVGKPGEDLHLMRGVAEVVEDVKDVTDPDADPNAPGTIEVTSHTAITVTTIETSGKITFLK